MPIGSGRSGQCQRFFRYGWIMLEERRRRLLRLVRLASGEGSNLQSQIEDDLGGVVGRVRASVFRSRVLAMFSVVDLDSLQHYPFLRHDRQEEVLDVSLHERDRWKGNMQRRFSKDCSGTSPTGNGQSARQMKKLGLEWSPKRYPDWHTWTESSFRGPYNDLYCSS